jgi:hypothetical protein
LYGDGPVNVEDIYSTVVHANISGKPRSIIADGKKTGFTTPHLDWILYMNPVVRVSAHDVED